ncbi:sugar transferase [PVC group bacterium]|nr:sugar transferase [PVC group bacterium]
MKNIFDKIFSFLLILFLSPLFLVIAILLKCSGWIWKEDQGPILYFEDRISEGKVFRLIKFRIIQYSILKEMRNKQGRINKIKDMERDDKNVTHVGRYLKKYYLDEILQLIHILKGEISFVGPRPWPVDDYNEEIKQGIYRKKIMKAGLTGWTQIHKGIYKNLEEERALDYEYIDRILTQSVWKSFLYDIGIMFSSVKTVFRAEGL